MAGPKGKVTAAPDLSRLPKAEVAAMTPREPEDGVVGLKAPAVMRCERPKQTGTHLRGTSILITKSELAAADGGQLPGGDVDAQVLAEHPQQPEARDAEHRGVGPHEDLCPDERGRGRARRAGDSARRQARPVDLTS